MLYTQYHCSCCNRVVASNDKECPSCGSHNIRSPYGFWIFCLVACLIVAIIVKVGHVYLSDHNEVPKSENVLEVVKSHHGI